MVIRIGVITIRKLQEANLETWINAPSSASCSSSSNLLVLCTLAASLLNFNRAHIVTPSRPQASSLEQNTFAGMGTPLRLAHSQ